MDFLTILPWALVGIFGTHCLISLLNRRATLHIGFRESGTLLKGIGLNRIPRALFTISDGRLRDAKHEFKSLVELMKDPKELLAELKGAVVHMAKTPEGLKMLTDGIAEAAKDAAAVVAAAK